jgi:hypothetical protein
MLAKSRILGIAGLLCLCAPELFAQHFLTVESAPAVTEGQTVYRFYVNMTDPLDRMSAVYGNDQAHLIVNTPEGAYNNPFNAFSGPVILKLQITTGQNDCDVSAGFDLVLEDK